jgi:signal transduction histidine kinase
MPAVPSHPSLDASKGGRALGAMIFSFFGAVWLEIWDWRAGAGPAAFAVIALLGLTLLARAWLRYRRFAPALALEPETPQKKRAARIFNIVNVGQWVVIVVLGNVLANLGLGKWVVPMAIVVVGLHFVPLAHVFRNRSHYALAAAMVGFAMLYPQLAPGGPADPVGFMGAGLMLWLGALWALREPAREAGTA